jgi:hypothetical protein
MEYTVTDNHAGYFARIGTIVAFGSMTLIGNMVAISRLKACGLVAATALMTAAILFTTPAAGQLTIPYVDYTIKESTTLEFDYYGTFDYLKKFNDAHGNTTWNNKLVFNRNIERTYWGTWQKAHFEIIRYDTGGNKRQIKQIDIKTGGKRYLGSTRYFGFAVFEASQYRVTPGPKTSSDDIFEGDGLYSFVLAGGGGGRVVDKAASIRARKVQDELIRRGVLTAPLSDSLFSAASDLLRKKQESSVRVLALQQLLSQSGITGDERLDVETVVALTRIIDGSADRLESGIEGRLGFGHELSKENERQDNLNLMGLRLKYAKPLSARLELVEEMDYLRGWADDGSSNAMKSLFRITYSTVKIEASAIYRLDLDARTYEIRGSDYSYARYFNELIFRAGYEIYNRINLSGVFKLNRTDYDNDFEIGSTASGWNRELHLMVNYEIF